MKTAPFSIGLLTHLFLYCKKLSFHVFISFLVLYCFMYVTGLYHKYTKKKMVCLIPFWYETAIYSNLVNLKTSKFQGSIISTFLV